MGSGMVQGTTLSVVPAYRIMTANTGLQNEGLIYTRVYPVFFNRVTFKGGKKS